MIYPLTSTSKRTVALQYMAQHLSGTLVYDRATKYRTLGGHGDLYIVGDAGKPESQDFRHGWGGRSSVATSWLVSEVLAHLRAGVANLCVIDDTTSRPSDPRLAAGTARPAWFFRGNVLWPITQDMAGAGLIASALTWGLVGRPEVVAFCSGLRPVQGPTTHTEISESLLQEIGRSTVRLATDIFDEEALLVWSGARGGRKGARPGM